MGRDERRNFDALVRDANEQSEKALYPYLKLHLFGPYQNDCYAYLTELKTRLVERGFFQTAICDDRGNEPPADFSQQQKWEFWWEESEAFLSDSDVAVFVFLDHIFERDSLPKRARKQAHDGGVDDNKEINSSVVGELMYWLTNENMDNQRVLILFEQGIYEEMGSVIIGATNASGVQFEVISNEDIESAIDEIRQRATNWVMGDLRDILVDRYHNEIL